MDELALLADADRRAHAYLAATNERRAFPDAAALAGLTAFDEPLPDTGRPADDVLRLLDERGTPATVASNGPELLRLRDRCHAAGRGGGRAVDARVGPVRVVLCEFTGRRDDRTPSPRAGSSTCSDCPKAARSGSARARRPARSSRWWPRGAARARKGWDVDADGLIGAPEVKVVISELAHITVKKALRVLGFGMKRFIVAPVDAHGRIDPAQLPALDDMTILCVQAGEVNTGEFDPFAALIPPAKAAGAWVHVDGAFGLWACSSKRALTDGIDGADSWTTDGHKWLNTPYDGAMVICRDAAALATAMNSDAVYLSGAHDAQKNLNLEFSRRARGIPVWAALRSLGRAGVATMVEQHCAQAARVADGLRAAGYDVLNRVVLNQGARARRHRR